MLIHHELIKSDNPNANLLPVVVLIHGLFGEGKNLKVLSDAISKQYNTLTVDLRNHGHSFHDPSHNYQCMAIDIIKLLDYLNIFSVNLIGHSMGGKVVMQLAQKNTTPQQIKINKLIVLDIAPVKYIERKHDDVFLALNQVIIKGCKTRLEASKIMNQFIESPAIIQFLLKSFDKGSWRFNLNILEHNYEEILNWHEISPSDKEILFLIGANSDYVIPSYKTSIIKQFPLSKAHIIAGADHWVHADRPEQVLKQILRFFDSV
ncbi:alpha/beta fold hydrolase [Thorsellia kenyensis]|uniref:Alpha/beta fold hydrolase n=1 Tax=Thorsellia kenyensis TaxID=1549888 RepID=A0ABV6C855_9GAMM